jgi:diacylglycerol kinase (ATP)
MKRLWLAFLYSLAGLKAAWQDEQAFRLEIYISLVAVPVAFFITPDWFERGLLIATLLLVLMAELMNSAIEACIDRIGEEHHSLSKKAKDCGSAAVLLAAIIAGVVWLGVLVSNLKILEG